MKIGKEKKWFLILCFLLTPFFKPVGPCYYDVVNTVFQIWKLISLALIILILVASLNLKRFIFVLPLAVFWAIFTINSFLYGGDGINILNNAITSIILIVFIKHLNEENSGKILLKTLGSIFSVYLVLQVISMIIMLITHRGIFGAENTTVYFLGYDNYSAFAVIPMVAVIFFSEMKFYKKVRIRYVILFVILLACYIWSKSVAASFALVLMGVVMLTSGKFAKISKIFTFRKIFAIFAIVLCLLMSLNVQGALSDILDLVMDKGTSFTSRTVIWEDALKLSAEKPFFGRGSLSTDMIESYYLYGASHAHNFILDILLATGIVGLVCFFIFVDGATKVEKEKTIKQMPVLILIYGEIVLIVLSFLDYYAMLQYQYCLLGLLYCYNYVPEMEKNKLDE